MTHQVEARSCRGFTLVELLVVIAIIAVLVGLLLPAIQKVRESASRLVCLNNLKQVGLALHAHHDANNAFPTGGVLSPSGPGYGHSWWVLLLPFIEQSALYEKFDKVGNPSTGWVGVDGNPTNAALIDGVRLPFMLCPSSPLVPLVEYWPPHPQIRVLNATYTGISGATDHPSAIDAMSPGNPGRISFGGVLIPYRPVRTSEISDGLSNTVVVGEQSDWCREDNGSKSECRSACLHGFCMGIPALATSWPSPHNDFRTFNLTTIVYRVNDKRASNVGVNHNCGSNSPIQSAHRGGANVLLGDGAARFLGESIALPTLYDLANRDDGKVVTDF